MECAGGVKIYKYPILKDFIGFIFVGKSDQVYLFYTLKPEISYETCNCRQPTAVLKKYTVYIRIADDTIYGRDILCFFMRAWKFVRCKPVV
jgi:hypothetical protein